MPRKAREKSSTGIYAVLIRGANESHKLFCDDEDYDEFMSRLDEYLDISAIAFALCENAICLIVKESEKGIGWDIKPVTTSYARYYGRKYELNGGLFERRFRSIPIETAEDMAAQIACVHRICEDAGLEGYTGRYENDELLLPETALSLMGGRAAYDAAMKADKAVTMFFAVLTGEKPKRNKPVAKPERSEKAAPKPKKIKEAEPEIKAEPVIEEKPKPKKKKNSMPSWLL